MRNGDQDWTLGCNESAGNPARPCRTCFPLFAPATVLSLSSAGTASHVQKPFLRDCSLIDVDSALSGPLQRWVRAVRQRAWLTLALCAVVTVACGYYAGANLGINSDTIQLFPEDLPARQNHDAFVAIFPDLENALLIVVDAATPEAARSASEQLVQILGRDHKNFEEAYLPGGGPFFERHALLYQSVDDLDQFSDHLLRVQPVIAELERDPSIANLTSLIQQALDRFEPSSDDDALWGEIFDRLGGASVEVYRENPLAISWEGLMLSGSAIDVVTRRVVLAHPVLDFSDALPAQAPLDAIRAAAALIASEADSSLRIRVTGNPALTHEETLSLAWDIGVSGIFCLLLVSVILFLALRSGPLVVAVVATLLTGLVWTGGFAAIAVGDLNVISIAAGVLFLGLGVDFGLHLGMRYADLLRGGDSHAAALDKASGSVGGSLTICTVTTAIGFFAFLPTDYKGVAELGLITGVGLIIILFLTLTLLPALLTVVFHANPERLRTRELRFGGAPSRFITDHAGAIRITAFFAFALSLYVVAELRFDANIVAMRDPSTESVQTFNDLLADSGTNSPWYANSVAASLEQADELKRRMQRLDAVERSITLSDYIPDEQEEKLEILSDVAFLLGPRGGDSDAVPNALPPDQQIAALRRLHDLVLAASDKAESPLLVASMRDLAAKLGDFLVRVDGDEAPERALAKLEEVLLSTFPEQVDRLHRALDASPVTRERLPGHLVRRLVTPDGRARVQTFPRENLEDHEAFTRFVEAVQSVDPNVTGIAVNLVEFARTTQEAFRQAIATAVFAISAILWLLWRRPRDVLLVMTPLALAGVATGAIMVLLGLSLNFFNVVVVPLLLGAGVDSGIHLVEQARRRKPGEVDVLGTTTARAVLFSALTTITSFGTLSFSSHVGLSGLGTLLTVGMFLTVVCNLVLLPALLAKFWRDPAHDTNRVTR